MFLPILNKGKPPEGKLEPGVFFLNILLVVKKERGFHRFSHVSKSSKLNNEKYQPCLGDNTEDEGAQMRDEILFVSNI